MSKIKLNIIGNGEQYTYDKKKHKIVGNGNRLNTLNFMIITAGYGENPYEKIADMMRKNGYTVEYEYTPDGPEVIDGI